MPIIPVIGAGISGIGSIIGAVGGMVASGIGAIASGVASIGATGAGISALTTAASLGVTTIMQKKAQKKALNLAEEQTLRQYTLENKKLAIEKQAYYDRLEAERVQSDFVTKQTEKSAVLSAQSEQIRTLASLIQMRDSFAQSAGYASPPVTTFPGGTFRQPVYNKPDGMFYNFNSFIDRILRG